MRFIIACLLTIFFTLAYAQEKTQGEKLLLVMGIDKVLEAQKEAQKIGAKKQNEAVMRQLSADLKGTHPKYEAEIRSLLDEMMDEILNSWTIERAIEIYSKPWADNFTEKELKEVIETFEKNENKKMLKMIMTASTALTNYVSDSYTRSTEEAMKRVMPKLKEIMANANASRVSQARTVGFFKVLTRNVQVYVEKGNELLVTAIVQSMKDFDKHPILEISFSDSNGNGVALYSFLPHEYLTDKNKASNGVKKMQTFDIYTLVKDPGQKAVNYQFNFVEQ